MHIATKFDFGDWVKIDGGDISGVVTTISVAGVLEALNYEVTYFHNGDAKAVWCREWRLQKIDPTRR